MGVSHVIPPPPPRPWHPGEPRESLGGLRKAPGLLPGWGALCLSFPMTAGSPGGGSPKSAPLPPKWQVTPPNQPPHPSQYFGEGWLSLAWTWGDGSVGTHVSRWTDVSPTAHAVSQPPKSRCPPHNLGVPSQTSVSPPPPTSVSPPGLPEGWGHVGDTGATPQRPPLKQELAQPAASPPKTWGPPPWDGGEQRAEPPPLSTGSPRCPPSGL